jgi:hypothetical protein
MLPHPVDAATKVSDAVTRIGGMTMTVSDSRRTHPWTIDDLRDTPEDGNRYEIADASLL